MSTLPASERQKRDAAILETWRKNPQLSVNGIAKLLGCGHRIAMRVIRRAGYVTESRRHIATAQRSKQRWTNYRKQVATALPNIVNSVLADSSGQSTLTPTEVAEKYDISMDMLNGIKSGRYDRYLAQSRSSKRLVSCNGTIMLYDEKGYEPSGKSIKGAIELSDDQQQLKCHECGGWFEDLGHHVHGAHAMKAKSYKRAHGLKISAALCNDRIRLRRIQIALQHGLANKARPFQKGSRSLRKGKKQTPLPTSYYNQRRNCAAQLAHDVRALADRLKHLPSRSDIERAGISVAILNSRYGSVGKALKTVLDKMPPKRSRKWYSDEELIGWIKNFVNTHKRPPFVSDCKRGLLVANTTFAKRFGSWSNALALAGVKGASKGWVGTNHATKLRRAARIKGAPPEEMHLGKEQRIIHAHPPDPFRGQQPKKATS